MALPLVDAPQDEERQDSCQLACMGRRPTETLQSVQLPPDAPIALAPAHQLAPTEVPIPEGDAHQEPPLLPPQRPEHKVTNMLHTDVAYSATTCTGKDNNHDNGSDKLVSLH